MAQVLKVLVVDDTVLYRKILKDVITEIDSTEVIGTAPNGDIALKKIEIDKPDLVLLDVEMPVKDGLETLQEIKSKYPEIGVIMISGVNERQANITMEALSKGAIDFIPKPSGNDITQNINSLKTSLIPIITLFQTRKAISSIRDGKPLDTASRKFERPATPEFVRRTEPVKPVAIPVSMAPLPRKVDVLVIGVSTGGPNALAKFIPMLPPDLGVPVLLVQHMPATFTKSLAAHLDNKSMISVCEAQNAEIIEKNKVYIAPGGKHLIIKKEGGRIVTEVLDSAPVNSCKPSVDVLFDSVTTVYPGNILSVIMTGMGSDGMNGVKTLKKTGCYSIAQSEDSCVVYGMPRAIDEAGLTDEQVNLDNLADRVTFLIKNGIK